MTRFLFPSALAALAMSGCATMASGPAPVAYAPRPAVVLAAEVFPDENWWEAYGDPQLDALIARALAAAPGLEAVAARLHAAAPRKVSGRPAPDLAADLDRWRRDRAVLAVAISEAECARMDAAQARVLLTTSLVSAYGELWRLAAERDAAEVRGDIAALAGLDKQLNLARTRLAVLAGAAPDGGLALRTPSAARAHFGLPSGLVEQLVSRRPDLLAARWRAAAAEQRLDAARSSAAPRLSLSAFLGRHALGLNHLVRSGSDIGQAGLNAWPPPEADRVDARVGAAQAEREMAAAAYEHALVGALRDVAQASAGEHVLDRRLTEARAALADWEAVQEGVRHRYEAGQVSKAALQAAEQAVIIQRSQVAGLQAKRLIADAALVRALGAGAGLAPDLSR